LIQSLPGNSRQYYGGNSRFAARPIAAIPDIQPRDNNLAKMLQHASA